MNACSVCIITCVNWWNSFLDLRPQLDPELLLMLDPRCWVDVRIFWFRHSIKFSLVDCMILIELQELVEVPTLLVDTKVYPRDGSYLHPYNSKHICRGMTLDILQGNINAMLKMCPICKWKLVVFIINDARVTSHI